MDNFRQYLSKIPKKDGKIRTDTLASAIRQFSDADVVNVKNVVDTYNGRGPKSTVGMFFDPSAVRKTGARFDPRLKHLANLSAAGAGVAGIAGGQSLLDYLTQQEQQMTAEY
jgi:hypothetical protein